MNQRLSHPVVSDWRQPGLVCLGGADKSRNANDGSYVDAYDAESAPLGFS